jgi:Leucine-zipper of ternary complex factor MIP1
VQSVADLVNEIATLELEVVNLERHLLTLYRTAFHQYLSSSSSTFNRASNLHTSFDQPQLQNIPGSHQLQEKLPKPFKTERGDHNFTTTVYTGGLSDHDNTTISNGVSCFFC